MVSVNMNYHVESSSALGKLNTAQDLMNSIVDSNQGEASYTNHFVVADMGNLKWQGSFEAVKYFLNVYLITEATKWTTPGGGLVIRWYSGSKSLTLKDERANELKDKIN